MFTKEVFINYFNELQRLEKEMISVCSRLLNQTSDPRIHELVKSIQKDELKHNRWMEDIKKMFPIIILSTFIFFPELSFSFGEITLTPGYYFKAEKIDTSRIGLYVQEEINNKWFYSSWTGSGKVFTNDSNSSDVQWISTNQDINYNKNEWMKIGAGIGYGLSHPSNQTDVDIHFQLAVKLWK